jgi:hypothetical protein
MARIFGLLRRDGTIWLTVGNAFQTLGETILFLSYLLSLRIPWHILRKYLSTSRASLDGDLHATGNMHSEASPDDFSEAGWDGVADQQAGLSE